MHRKKVNEPKINHPQNVLSRYAILLDIIHIGIIIDNFIIYKLIHYIIQFRSSDRLVTDRDIRIKELERLYLEKQKVILEKQERILQSYK